MRRIHHHDQTLERLPHQRSGHLMVFFSMSLVMLLGFVGLVFDTGRMHAAHREAQNAADAAATAAAMAKFLGQSNTGALSEANLLRVQNSPGSLPLALNAGARSSLNIPPLAGSRAGNADFVEAYVTVPVDTMFMHVLGIAQNREVAARAVAGQEPPTSGEGVIVLDPQAIAGIGVMGSTNSQGTILKVNGGVLINSLGSGYNQWGQWQNTFPSGATGGNKTNTTSSGPGNTSPAVSTQQTNMTPAPSIEARYVIAAGGAESSNAAAFKSYGDSTYPNGVNPLIAATRQLFADPLRGFPVPQPAVDSRVDVTVRDQSNDSTPDGKVALGTGESDTLQPGLYNDISITGDANVTFAPGVYILSPDNPNQGLRINGNPIVTGNGVMFYLTGSNYVSSQGAGYWDVLDDSTNNQLDGPLPPTSGAWNTQQGQSTNPPGTDPAPGNTRFASVDINVGAGSLNLSGLSSTGGVLDNMLFFARRRNNSTIRIAGNAGQATINLSGVVYAKWSLLDVSGGGNWTAQFVVGSLKVSGGAQVTILGAGQSFGLAKLVYLVE